MADQQTPPAGPDLSKGIPLSEFAGEILLGHVGDDEVVLVRSGSEIFAIGAHCSHYHGPLAEGLVTGEGIRCPWHHACFDLHTGEATRAPSLSPIPVWKVEQEDGRILVREKREQPKPQVKPRVKGAIDAPRQIVIVGGGAAGFAAAEMLRRQDYRGSIVMLSSEAAAPVDRPNLSKTISPAARRRTGCRCGRMISMPRRRSTCGSRPRSRRSTPTRAMSSHQAARPFLMTACCWRPAPSRCGCRYRVRTSPMCTCCARWPIPAPSLHWPMARGARS